MLHPRTKSHRGKERAHSPGVRAGGLLGESLEGGSRDLTTGEDGDEVRSLSTREGDGGGLALDECSRGVDDGQVLGDDAADGGEDCQGCRDELHFSGFGDGVWGG